MTDSNKDKELDKLNNEEKKALDDQAKTAGESNPTLVARVLPIAPLRVINGGGGFKPVVIPGGKPAPNTKPLPIIDPTLPWERTDPIQDEIVPRPSIEQKELLPEVTVTPAKPLKPIYQPPYKDPVDKVIRDWEKERQRRNKKNQEPGGSPQRESGGKKKKVTTEEKPFDNNQFHQGKPPTEHPRPENPEAPGKEVSPSEFGRTVNPPAKKPTKRRTPAERNVVTNGPSANTPQAPAATPPATTPTPAQNPAAPAPTPITRRQETKKEAVEREFAGRPINSLTEADKRKISEGGYTLSTNPKSGPPMIRRTSHTSGKSGLHMENVGGVWTIQKGPAPANNRLPSSPSKMKKNILKGTGVKEIPLDYQIHHNLTVETWKAKELTKLAQKYGLAGGVDAEDGMILAPSTLEAKNRTGGDIDKLEQQGKLIRILHPGSHPAFTEYGSELIKQEEKRLKLKYGVKNLEKIPPDKLPGELENSVKKVRKEIDDELKNADQKIKAGKYNELPQEIKNFIKPDPNRQNQYKISDQPTDQEVARFKNALGDVVAKARKINTYNLSGVSSQEVLSSTNLSTQQSYAEMLALSVAAAKGGDPATKNSIFTDHDNGSTIGIYANGSKLASIERKNGKAETITMERGMTASEKQHLNKQRSEMNATSQSQAQAQKAQKIASKGNSLQRGM